MTKLPSEDFTALTGVVLFVAHYFEFPFTDNDVILLLSSLLTIGGILWSHFNAVKDGKSTLGGFVK